MVQKGFYFDEKRCIGCHSCEVACKSWNDLPVGPRWRRTVKVGAGSYPKVKMINVSLACMHCGKPKCLTACPVKAITKRVSDGIIEVDKVKCIGCGFCIWACPFNAPQLGADGKIQKCTFCDDRPDGMPRACEEICPQKAIVSGTMDELDEKARERAAIRLIGETEPSFYVST